MSVLPSIVEMPKPSKEIEAQKKAIKMTKEKVKEVADNKYLKQPALSKS